MAKIIFDLGDLVDDSYSQFGVVFDEDRALVMCREGNSFRPVVRSVKGHGLLPVHEEAVKNIPREVKLALLSVITAMSLPNHLPAKDTDSSTNLRDK